MIRLWLLGVLFLVISPFSGFASDVLSHQSCGHLLRTSSRTLSELVDLRAQISRSLGALRSVLESEWQIRLAQLSAPERQLLAMQFRLQSASKVESFASSGDLFRQQQLAEFQLFSKDSLKVEIEGPFEPSETGSFLQGTAQVSRFVPVRRSYAEKSTRIVDLETARVSILPTVGKLSLEGDLFLEVVTENWMRIHDLRTQKHFELRGSPTHDPKAFRNSGLIARVPGTDGQETHVYYSFRRPDIEAFELGTEVQRGLDGRYILAQAPSTLKLFDTELEKFIDHPIVKDLLKEISFRKLGDGFVSGERILGWKSLWRKQQFALDLNSLQFHDLTEQGIGWLAAPGTRMLFAMDRDDPQMPLTLAKSMISEQQVQMSGDKEMVFQRGSDFVWMLQGSNWVQHDLKTGQLLHVGLSNHNWRLHRQGFVTSWQNGALVFLEPDTGIRYVVPSVSEDAALFWMPQQQRIFSIQTLGDGLSRVMEYNYESQSVREFETPFAAMSPDGRWIVIQNKGNLEFHATQDL